MSKEQIEKFILEDAKKIRVMQKTYLTIVWMIVLKGQLPTYTLYFSKDRKILAACSTIEVWFDGK